MGNGSVKGFLALLLLVVLSTVIGTQMAGDVQEQEIGLALISIVVGAVGCLILGKKVWWVIFLLPWFLTFLPAIHGTHNSFARGLTWHYALAPLSLGVWLVLWSMRRVSFEWKKLPWADFLVLLPYLYFIGIMIVYPASIAALGLDTDHEGGIVVLYALLGAIHYILISALPVPREDFPKLFRYIFYVYIAGELIKIVLNLSGFSGVRPWEAFGTTDGEDVRCDVFYGISMWLMLYSMAKYPIASLKSMLSGGLAVFSVLLMGSREYILRLIAVVGMIALLRREIIAPFLVGCMLIAGIYGLSANGYSQYLPSSVQRIAFLLPGVKLNAQISQSTRGSSIDRFYAWKQALDPRTGEIKNRIFGDGFQRSKAANMRRQVYLMRRGKGNEGMSTGERLRLAGDWHNGFITTMHRMGLVTVVMLFVYMMYAFVLCCKVFRACMGTKDGAFMAPFCFYWFSEPFFYWWFDTVERFFSGLGWFVYLKILYCHLRDEGRIEPLFMRHRYIPMMIRDSQHVSETPFSDSVSDVKLSMLCRER